MKITKSTFKSFIKKNANLLYILRKTEFDGMTDGCNKVKGAKFKHVTPTTEFMEHTLGITGLWLVGGGRDYFTAFDNGKGMTGYEVINCCGRSVVCVASWMGGDKAE